MINERCLNANYSTTRLATKERPEIINNLEDQFETVLFLPKFERRIGEGGLRKKGYYKKSFDDKPLISIVTVVFNGERYIEETIQSVINQSYDNVEYIIIDGGSNDRSVDIIKKYENQIDYWVSEKDNGIYDAMNKGIKLSTGAIIGIINSDDWYEADIFKDIISVHKDSPNLGLIHGVMNIYNKDKVYKGTRRGQDLPLVNLMSTPFKHPTCFISLEIYKKIGLYNTQYKLAADYDFMLRIIKNNISRIFVNKPISSLRQVGVTSGSKGVSAENEIIDIIYKNIKIKFLAYIFIFYRRLRKII